MKRNALVWLALAIGAVLFLSDNPAAYVPGAALIMLGAIAIFYLEGKRK